MFKDKAEVLSELTFEEVFNTSIVIGVICYGMLIFTDLFIYEI